MSRKKPLAAVIQANTRKTCSVDGCPNSRTGISKYCPKHQSAMKMHGDPLGRTIRRREYAKELQEVGALMARCHDHPGLVKALKQLSYVLHTAIPAGDWKVPAVDELPRLSAGGVSAVQALKEATAVRLYFMRDSRLDEGQQLTWAMGRAVLMLAPRKKIAAGRYRYVGSTPRKELGEYFRKDLGGVVNGMVIAIMKQDELRQQALLDMHRPFVTADNPEELQLGTAGLALDESTNDPHH